MAGLAESIGRALRSGLGSAAAEGMRGVQRVLVVLQPGPLRGQLGRWRHDTQAGAEDAVRAAVERFAQLRGAAGGGRG